MIDGGDGGRPNGKVGGRWGGELVVVVVVVGQVGWFTGSRAHGIPGKPLTSAVVTMDAMRCDA